MPTPERALLTRHLRKLRASKHMTLERVAGDLDWSMSKLIRIEGGIVGISTTDLRALLAHYGVTDPTVIRELEGLSKKARIRGWWTQYKDSQDQQFLDYVGYEAGAASIKMWQPLLIPGLLQTAEYATEIARAFFGENPERISGVVEFRLERQRRIMRGPKPPEQTYILDEAVILRAVGFPDRRNIMSHQLRHLVELASRREIRIRIAPFTAGALTAVRGPFTLLGFDNELDELLYLESSRTGDLTLHDPSSTDVIADYLEVFDALDRVALASDDSVKRLIRAADGFYSPEGRLTHAVPESQYPP